MYKISLKLNFNSVTKNNLRLSELLKDFNKTNTNSYKSLQNIQIFIKNALLQKMFKYVLYQNHQHALLRNETMLGSIQTNFENAQTLKSLS